MIPLMLPIFRKTICSPTILPLRVGMRPTHWHLKMAGNREQVGYGVNGQPVYFDSAEFPFPAIRWKEPTPELCVSVSFKFF